MGVTFNPFTGNLDFTKNPGGSDTQLQFNDGGAFGGSADLTWDDASKVLAIGGDIDLDNGGAFSTTLQMITATANRVISFPDATGTVALVAGSSGQLLYNSAGANAGLGTLATDGTNITLAGRFTNSTNGAASAPPSSLTGTWFTGGTATTTKPQLLIEPAGTTSTAWSTSGTGLGVNAPSGFTGRLLDLQVNGTSYISTDHSNSAQVLSIASTTSSSAYIRANGSLPVFFGANNDQLVLDINRNPSTGTFSNTGRSHARITIDGSSGGSSIQFATANANNTTNTERLRIKSAGAIRFVTAFTVGTLPTGEVGDIARVTDATAPAVGSTVAGSGAAAALVWYNGTNWTVIGV